MNDIDKIEELKLKIGTVKFNRNLNALIAAGWSLCEIYTINKYHDEPIMIGLNTLCVGMYTILGCSEHSKLKKLRKDKKFLEEYSKLKKD